MPGEGVGRPKHPAVGTSRPDLRLTARNGNATMEFTHRELNLLQEVMGGFIYESEQEMPDWDPEEGDEYRELQWRLTEAYRLAEVLP